MHIKGKMLTNLYGHWNTHMCNSADISVNFIIYLLFFWKNKKKSVNFDMYKVLFI